MPGHTRQRIGTGVPSQRPSAYKLDINLMTQRRQKRELTWIGKEHGLRLEPRRRDFGVRLRRTRASSRAFYAKTPAAATTQPSALAR